MTYRGHVTGPNGEYLAPTTVTPESLAAAGEAERLRINRAVEAREEREAAARAEQARRDAERGQLELDHYRDQARAAILSSGGTSADFERLWPDLRAAYLKDTAEAKLTSQQGLIEQTKAEMRASGRFTRF
jgi:hypothetical protein